MDELAANLPALSRKAANGPTPASWAIGRDSRHQAIQYLYMIDCIQSSHPSLNFASRSRTFFVTPLLIAPATLWPPTTLHSVSLSDKQCATTMAARVHCNFGLIFAMAPNHAASTLMTASQPAKVQTS